jgi:glycosyltransferase involved in cell wall biosynthesis
LNVLGEGYREAPECFATARSQLDSVIDHWGYVENRETYWSVLQASDVVVSTAAHEFFGIAMVEAVAAGCRPLVPRRLAYPEVLGDGPAWFHNDDPEDIARRLHALAEAKAAGRWDPTEDLARRLAERYAWDRLAGEMDQALLGLGRSLPGLGA